MEPLLDLELLSGFAPEPQDQADLLQTMLDSLRADIGQLEQVQDIQDLHRLLHTLKGYLCYATRAPVWQSLSEWCERTRAGEADQLLAFARIWPTLKPDMLQLSSAIEAWLSSYHSR